MSTPTKAAEIREALEHAKKFIAFIEQYTEVKVDPMAMPKIDSALALLADMEREGEPVAWLNEYMGLTMNNRSKMMHDAEGTKHGYTIPLYRHPSPTTADAMADLARCQAKAKDLDFDAIERHSDECSEQ